MTNRPHVLTLLTLLLSPLLAVGCSDASDDDDDAGMDDGNAYDGAPDPELGELAIGQQVDYPTDGWTVVDPSEMSMAQADLDKAMEYAFGEGMNTQGVVIIRGGAIVAERYADERDQDSPATSWSAAKSFASALIGIAKDDGLIDASDQPMGEFLSGWQDSAKGDIPLRSVLTMQSGLDFIEDYSDTDSEMVQLASAPDALEFAMGLEPARDPDTNWYYSSGDTMLLSGVIESATGMNAGQYARARLFDPIGMDSATWWTDQSGHSMTYCCVDSTTREFAKFGLLFLRNGHWDGEQVVSQQWVRESTQTLATNYDGYAYQWWASAANTAVDFPSDMYSAQGLDTQRIIVIPSLDLVIAKNTLYDKPDREEVASGTLGQGWLLDIQPRGGSGTDDFLMKSGLDFLVGTIRVPGTQAPLLWEDAVFVSHIINAIEGSAKLPAEPSVLVGTFDDDPAACRELAGDGYGEYCEAMHGCMCDECGQQFFECDGVPQCAAIIACALEVQCRGIGCLTPCEEVIQESGGVDGAGVQLALSLSECADEPTCPLNCD